jgi:hypothetical protein
MSYIKQQLMGQTNSNIYNFLIKEGFKEDSNPFGYGKCMLFVASENYTVWFCVHEDYIYLNAEYDCGGTFAETQYDFDKEDMESFMSAYYQAVEWTKSTVN